MLARALRQAETPGDCCHACRDAAPLEALLPCPGRREIYLREIVCEYCTYSNLCNPSELSLRTLKRYRSLCPRTRQCLQPEGIVKVYGKCYCCQTLPGTAQTLYGEVVIKSRYLEAKPLKFSPPKSLCGTVGSPWVSLATLFGFWETLIKFSESMILYGEKSFFRFFFFLARFKLSLKILQLSLKKIRR